MKQCGLNNSIIHILEKNKYRIKEIDENESGRELIANLFKDLYFYYSNNSVDNVINLVYYFIIQEKTDINHLLDILRKRIRQDNLLLQTEEIDKFDLEFGTKTSLIREQFELDELISPIRYINSERYYPTPVKVMDLAFDLLGMLGINYNEFIFIDVGSGMGRNLLLASGYPFKKIIGIEISNYLHRIALNNINIYKSAKQKCENLELNCIDILDYELPVKENLIFYFWGPFSDNVFNVFYSNLIKSISLTENKVIFVFFDAVYSMVEKHPFLKKIDIFKFNDRRMEGIGQRISIYTT